MKEFLFYMRFGQWLIKQGRDPERLQDVVTHVVAPDLKEAERITRRYYEKKFETELNYTGARKKISSYCYDSRIVETFIQEPPVALRRNVLLEKYLSKETIYKAVNAK